jgi:hypothetical protein
VTEFVPSIFLYGDRAGQGRWEIGHYRQHVTYVTHLATRANPVLIPDHPLMVIGTTDLERRVWLEDHAATHGALRELANVSGIDLSEVDFENPEEFNVWLDSHSLEHSLIDAAFGL